MSEYNLKAKDFKSDQEVRWCPACGDTAFLNAMQKTLVDIEMKKENAVFVSGIGCSSRFPYYMDTYGFHGIHGRASALATGVKLANPELTVWQITGDGDAMAIGGNHFIHTIRRNIDVNIILLNNEIYGLTKGQYSPTSKHGQVTKSSPFGTIENPFNPGELAIGAQGKFFARVVDNNISLMKDVLKEAYYHKGTSLVEVLQNCIIFNDGAHSFVTNKETKEDHQLILEQDKPMIFGKNRDKGLMFDEKRNLQVVKIGENGITEADIIVHNSHDNDIGLHYRLANLKHPEFPTVLGVIRSIKCDTYNEKMTKQIEEVQQKTKIKSLEDLLFSGKTWKVE